MIKNILWLLLLVIAAAGRIGAQTPLHDSLKKFVHLQGMVKSISQASLSPDGRSIAWSADGADGSQVIFRAPLDEPGKAVQVSAGPISGHFNETEPEWSPDGRQLAFLTDWPDHGQLQVCVADVAGGAARVLTQFNGYISRLRWSPDGAYLSVLYVEKSSREPSPMAAVNKPVGIIDSMVNRDIQRIAVINILQKQVRQLTPPDKYVFEYDWDPASRQLAYTAAAPPGDDNWYIAGLYTQRLNDSAARLVYQPQWQIAVPRWSPDGKQIAFIEGLMSDQGGTGGEIFLIPVPEGSAGTPGGQPRNLTPGVPYTPSWLCWRNDGNLIFTAFDGAASTINQLNVANGSISRLWQADASIQASSEQMSIAVGGLASKQVFAFTRMGWNVLPEIWGGPPPKLSRITQLNTAVPLPLPKAENIEWVYEGHHVQGWLLYPSDYDPKHSYPLLVNVHGGPAWIATPTWSAPDFNATYFTRQGYFVFFPNARGSYGQGEAFTRANRRDWGYGDVRDILCGVDTLLHRYPIDSLRMGIMGWSYGGSSAMFAVTQTHRFKAAVAGAGAGDWVSYYGQNSIDKWMQSYFGASPYDDPAAYQKVSAMSYIKNVKTPVLLVVGELDGEAPSVQSMQYWHALKELSVPTSLVIYPDEGHAFHKMENQVDVVARTIEWFNRWLKPR